MHHFLCASRLRTQPRTTYVRTYVRTYDETLMRSNAKRPVMAHGNLPSYVHGSLRLGSCRARICRMANELQAPMSAGAIGAAPQQHLNVPPQHDQGPHGSAQQEVSRQRQQQTPHAHLQSRHALRDERTSAGSSRAGMVTLLRAICGDHKCLERCSLATWPPDIKRSFSASAPTHASQGITSFDSHDRVTCHLCSGKSPG